MNDILLDNNYDIHIVNGDLDIGLSDSQQAQLLLQSSPGEWKESPTHGVGVAQYLEHHDKGQLARRIQTELTADGMRVNRININNSNIHIDAAYEDN